MNSKTRVCLGAKGQSNRADSWFWFFFLWDVIASLSFLNNDKAALAAQSSRIGRSVNIQLQIKHNRVSFKIVIC